MSSTLLTRVPFAELIDKIRNRTAKVGIVGIDDLRESPALTIIELLQKEGAEVSYNDPFFSFVGKGRKYSLQMTSTPLDKIAEFDCVVVVTDHSGYDYERIVNEAQIGVDTRNATKGISSPKIIRC